MKQYYAKYTEWEDYKQGMFNVTDILDKDKKVINAINLLSDQIAFYNTCRELVINWPVAANVNLSNKGQNRRAWLGAAACMYRHKTPEYLTRIAWNLLNKDTQEKANLVADKIILEYENKIPHVQTLFD